jgi:hypothetical protein
VTGDSFLCRPCAVLAAMAVSPKAAGAAGPSVHCGAGW